MEEQVDRLVKKTWENYTHLPPSQRLLIGVSGIPGSGTFSSPSLPLSIPPSLSLSLLTSHPPGKTTLAAIVSSRLNALHAQHSPATANSNPLSAFLPMDGYHLSRRQLDALPDPVSAHARRGAEFTFDGEAFLKLVTELRKPVCPETQTLFAPSFDHSRKDPGE
ncbi:hypothetical protein GRF29_8g3180059 [Pseudopithomyces chartarum]|uniref:Uncharacterized protein n=1 Tax=Pseudopithomyces chartarum TaxID=1892770 RepID=A0AAN6M7J4_9PLEO|nr:hypothetical protein GRF29_8g3180059 [Pseudopithomyces chartarum]